MACRPSYSWLAQRLSIRCRVVSSSPIYSAQYRYFTSRPQVHEQESGKTSSAQDEAISSNNARKRSRTAKTPLQRAALEAEKSRGSASRFFQPPSGHGQIAKTVTAFCAAEEFDMEEVTRILLREGHHLDPHGTKLYPQVIHIELSPNRNEAPKNSHSSTDKTDVFIFPSGTVVAWGMPGKAISDLAASTLAPAAVSPYRAPLEEEDLECIEDESRDTSTIKGDTVVLGTNHQSTAPIDIILTKLAFASGLARSTKLAVLESSLGEYVESTKSIPRTLMNTRRGSSHPFTRPFIIQQTARILELRAQLNLYSELTDSLPDLFWDSRHELGLEHCYDQVCHALDINLRIKALNQKVDYGKEIASFLREQLSEQHSLRLEWVIIILIAIEVGFGMYHIYEGQRPWETNKEHSG